MRLTIEQVRNVAALARLGLELEPLERGVHERTAIALPSALGDGVTAAVDTGAALTVQALAPTGVVRQPA